jgi:uncharacterized membrane protein
LRILAAVSKEAFSEGVIAIIITIMVLEMKIPHGDHWQELLPVAPTFLSYVLSFVYVGIYWNNQRDWIRCQRVVSIFVFTDYLISGWR